MAAQVSAGYQRVMRTLECHTLSDLEEAIASFGPDALFRGQTQEYFDEQGAPRLLTSFDRQMCHPPQMLKWQHYARGILSEFVHGHGTTRDLATDQAILQHYGWRSFFLDATSDPGVAAWFASHAYSEAKALELIEDVDEQGLLIHRRKATYQPSTGEAVLYVFSRAALRAARIGAVDLAEIMTRNGRPRYVAQSAFMVGLVHGPFPAALIAGRIVAKAETLAEYAAQRPHLDLEHLFPSEKDDPVLEALLALPWVRQPQGSFLGLGVFLRGLPLPEYQHDDVRRTGARTAYYSRCWVANHVAGTVFRHTDFYLAGETFVHGIADTGMRFPRLAALLRRRSSIMLEIDGLVRPPYGRALTSYGKGVYFELQPDQSILVTELGLEYRGLSPGDFAISRGYYYRPDHDGVWRRIDHPEACPCGHAPHHERHLVTAARFEHALSSREFRQIGPRRFAERGVVMTDDPAGSVDRLRWLGETPAPAA